MKIVVTGGTGFIGSHLVKRLVDEGRKVVVVSDFAHLGTENLLDLGFETSDIELRKADLTDYAQTLKAIKGADVIYHLAARVGSLEYLHGTEMSELATLQINLVIDANIFKACLEKRVKKFIYASSCAVYPMDKQSSLGAIFTEDDCQLSTADYRLPTINPDGGYGWSKLTGEIQLNWMSRLSTLDSRLSTINIGIARIFNVYGECEPLREKAHVVGDLIQKTILSQKVDSQRSATNMPDSQTIDYRLPTLTVRGDGNQTRDFLYVSDCVDALLKLEQKLPNSTNSMNPRNPITVNIGSGKPTKIRTIAEKIVELSGNKINITYDLTKPVGPISRTADITKARALLNWQPKISLDEGLRRTYLWVERRLMETNRD